MGEARHFRFGVHTLNVVSISIRVTDRYVACQMAPISVTLIEPEGHLSCLKHLLSEAQP